MLDVAVKSTPLGAQADTDEADGAPGAGYTLMVMLYVAAHCPAAGVNVYWVVAVLFMVAGDHVPGIPLLDVVGNGDKGVPAQTGATNVNVGVTGAFTVMVTVVEQPLLFV